MRMKIWTSAAAILWGLAAGEAHGAVTVLGGAQAVTCSRAAFAGESSRHYKDICTKALEHEFLDRRDRAGTLVNRGVMKLRTQDWFDAQRDFETAVRLQADMGEAHVDLAAAHIAQGRYAEAIEHIDRGLALGTAEPAKAYFNRALAREAMSDTKAAYFDFLKAQELDPTWEEPRRQLTRFTVSRRGGS